MNENERALLRYVVEGDIRKSQQQAKIVLEGLTTVKDKAFKESASGGSRWRFWLAWAACSR